MLDELGEVRPVSLLVEIHGGEKLGAGALEDGVRELRRDLLGLDVEAVEPAARGALPEGAKAGESIGWGVLVVTLFAGGGVVSSVVALFREHLERRARQGAPPIAVTVRIGDDVCEITGPSTDVARDLVSAFVRRHDPSARV
jgi:hypothetical protein